MHYEALKKAWEAPAMMESLILADSAKKKGKIVLNSEISAPETFPGFLEVIEVTHTTNDELLSTLPQPSNFGCVVRNVMQSQAELTNFGTDYQMKSVLSWLKRTDLIGKIVCGSNSVRGGAGVLQVRNSRKEAHWGP